MVKFFAECRLAASSDSARGIRKQREALPFATDP